MADLRRDILLFSCTNAHIQSCLHMSYYVSLWCWQEFNVFLDWAEGGCRVLWGWSVGSWRVSVLQCHNPTDGGCCVAPPPCCRVRAPETTGALPLNVTNAMWHVAACSRTLPPFTHARAWFFSPSVSLPGTKKHPNRQEQTHKYKKEPVAFLYFSFHKARHGNAKTLKQRSAVTHSCMNTHTHTHYSTPPVAVIKSSHSALHYVKVTACFYSPRS